MGGPRGGGPRPTLDLVLELSTRPLGDDPVDPTAAWEATADAWAVRSPTWRARSTPRGHRWPTR